MKTTDYTRVNFPTRRYDVFAESWQLRREIADLREKLAEARALIERGVELMTPEQLGRWRGVRAWLEEAGDGPG